MQIKTILKQIFNKINFVFLSSFDRDLLKAKSKNEGQIQLFEHPFYFHHGRAFFDTYNEVFKGGIYQFKTHSKTPLIIDCGANMGLSLLFFKRLYPESQILAFEPDTTVLSFLNKNIASQSLDNVSLYENAVWNKSEELTFFTDNGMGGRIGVEYKNQIPIKIQALRLRDFLDQPVHMLKIDIEGAEYAVLKDCSDRLHNVEHIFVEYHSDLTGEQHLDDILNILKTNGFRYHLKESFSRKKPFVSKHVLCEKFDMAINVFAYKN